MCNVMAKSVKFVQVVSPGILCVYIEKNDDFSWFKVENLLLVFCTVSSNVSVYLHNVLQRVYLCKISC